MTSLGKGVAAIKVEALLARSSWRQRLVLRLLGATNKR
jgi:hypothetical protein